MSCGSEIQKINTSCCYQNRAKIIGLVYDSLGNVFVIDTEKKMNFVGLMNKKQIKKNKKKGILEYKSVLDGANERKRN